MLQAAAPRLILASASLARRALLEAAGLRFEILPASVDETVLKQQALHRGDTAGEAALLLARAKAKAISAPGCLVVGCDQILVCDDIWFDKPADRHAARSQLLALRGRGHRLETACVCLLDGLEVWHHTEAPTLVMRDFSEPFLDAYLDQEGDRLLQCVGAYRLEGRGIHLFSRVGGQHTAILGLPLPPFLDFLRSSGVLAN